MIIPGKSYVHSLGLAANGLNPNVAVPRRCFLQQIDYYNGFINTILLFDIDALPFVNSTPKMTVRLPTGRHTFNYPNIVFENGLSYAISDIPYEGVIKTPEYASVFNLNLTYMEPPLQDRQPLREVSGFTEANAVFEAHWEPPMDRLPHIEVTTPEGNLPSITIYNKTNSGCSIALAGQQGPNRFIWVRAY